MTFRRRCREQARAELADTALRALAALDSAGVRRTWSCG